MTLSRLSRMVIGACIAAGAIACTGDDSPTTPIAFVGPANLVITDLTAGTGATAAAGQTVDARYSLWLYDPRQPESKGTAVESGRVSIRLAAGSVIQGWVEGVPGMKVGGTRRLIIPPSLGYGAAGSGPIPPNAWTVFDIELLGIVN